MDGVAVVTVPLLCKFQVHRCVLEESSAYFEAMFNSETTEKTTGKLIIQETSEEAVEALVDFIYLGKLPPTCRNFPAIVHLFKLAHRYTVGVDLV